MAYIAHRIFHCSGKRVNMLNLLTCDVRIFNTESRPAHRNGLEVCETSSGYFLGCVGNFFRKTHVDSC